MVKSTKNTYRIRNKVIWLNIFTSPWVILILHKNNLQCYSFFYKNGGCDVINFVYGSRLHTDRQPARQTDTQTGRQTDRHTDNPGIFGPGWSNTFSQWKWLNVNFPTNQPSFFCFFYNRTQNTPFWPKNLLCLEDDK